MSRFHDDDLTAPRWTRTLLARLAPADRVDEVLGDLEETYRDRARRHMPIVSTLLTAVEVLDVAIALLRERGDRRAAERRRGLTPGKASIWLDALSSDVRYAVRGLRANPGFTAAVVATLALGVGVNAAIFPVVDRLLFRMPPMLAEPALTNRVYLALPAPNGAGEFFIDDVSYPMYQRIAQESRSFARMAQAQYRMVAIGSSDAARELPVGIVSASFFDLFDAPPALGRYFVTGDDAPPSGAAVAVLSYDAWQTRYGGSASVLASTLRIASNVYTIVGVAPRGFVGTWPEHPPIAFVPTSAYQAASATASGRRGNWWASEQVNTGTVLVSRKPGVGLQVANADLSNVVLQWWEATMKGSGLNLIAETKPRAMALSLLAERGPEPSAVARVAALVGGMALVVLLIACGNVANLLLARAMRRRREIAVRLALGVSIRRLVSQLLTESILLSMLGGVAGLIVGSLAGALFRDLIARDSVAPPTLDGRTIAFASVALIATGILTGLGPVLMIHRRELTQHLKAGARDGVERSRLRVALLVLQAAMSMVLLVGAVLFVRSLENARRQPLGFDPGPVLYAEVAMADVRLTPERGIALRERLVATAAALPVVERAAIEYVLPLANRHFGSLRIPGIDSIARMRMPDFYMNAVSTDYFSAMGTRILRGRAIANEDAAGAPGAIVVSNTLAKLLWPDRDPIGQCVHVEADTACTNVVGVAEDVRATSLQDSPAPYYYLSAAQVKPSRGWGLVMRVRGNPVDQTESVRSVLQREMPGASYVIVRPLSAVVGEAMRSWRIGAAMFALFGGLALVLAAVGLYGVVAYDITQRTHEIGVRVALGARVVNVLWLVVRQGLALAFAGVGIGTLVSIGVAGKVALLLFGVSARDPIIYSCVAIVMLLVAIAASAVPAYRAVTIDPNTALRTD